MPPSAPANGTYNLSLATPAFFVLVVTLALFILMLFLLRQSTRGKRAFEGYLDAAGVSLGFLVFAVGLVVGLSTRDPHGNRTAFALYSTVLTGYWLAFAIPVVTVGSSVQARSRGAIQWLLPAIGVAILMFFALFGYYYVA
ncbi:MAG: hypothetical protein ACLPZM_01805 [Thermoplasmata archaeon]